MSRKKPARNEDGSKRLLLKLGRDEWLKLQTISATFGTSWSSGLRVCINAAYDKLGFENKFSDDGL